MANEKETKKQPEPPRHKEDSGEGSPPMRGVMAWALVLSMFMLMAYLFVNRQESSKNVSYSELRELVTQKRIIQCQLVREVSGIEYVLAEVKPEVKEVKPGTAPGPAPKPLKIKAVVRAGDKLEEFLNTQGVQLDYVNQNPIMWQLVSNVLPIVLIFGLLYFLFIRQLRAAGSGALSFGKSRARMLTEKHQPGEVERRISGETEVIEQPNQR